MVIGPKSAVFTTVRARDGKLFHLDLHLQRLARHAAVLGIEVPDIEIPEGTADDIFRLPVAHEVVRPILANLPLQLFAYHFAQLRGLDVDKPRNLAKSVTVE